MSYSRTQHRVTSQDSNPDRSIWRRAHQRCGHHASTSLLITTQLFLSMTLITFYSDYTLTMRSKSSKVSLQKRISWRDKEAIWKTRDPVEKQREIRDLNGKHGVTLFLFHSKPVLSIAGAFHSDPVFSKKKREPTPCFSSSRIKRTFRIYGLSRELFSSAHSYCARKFTPQRALSNKMNNDRADHC